MTHARLVFPAIRWSVGSGFAAEEPAIAQALDLGVGGFIIFGGPADAVAALTADLERRAGRPLLFGSDLERGAGQQFDGLTQLPPPGALAALGDLDAIRQAAAITAAEARSVGVDWVFAPVADLDVLPDNPIVQSRAFGADPGAVSAAVAAWIESAQAGGALACVKHYPGHGRTHTDSHAGVPVVDAPQAVLEDNDLRPFAAAFAAGVASVMTAHVAYPALDPSGRPATFSAPILSALRTRHGFGGLIVTDALIMEGARGERGPGRAAVDALSAGADLLLYPPDTPAVVASLDEAIGSGELDRARVQEALGRYDAALSRVVATRTSGRRPANADEPRNHELAAHAIADRVVAAGAPDAPLQLSAPLTLELVDDDQGGPYPPGPNGVLADTLGALGVTVGRSGATAGGSGSRIVAVFAEPRAWKGRAGLSDAAHRRIAELAADAALIVLFAHPRVAAELSVRIPILVAWHRLPLMQAAAARWIASHRA
jgi:beta-glucosidase